jgi:hypothetical protein
MNNMGPQELLHYSIEMATDSDLSPNGNGGVFHKEPTDLEKGLINKHRPVPHRFAMKTVKGCLKKPRIF